MIIGPFSLQRVINEYSFLESHLRYTPNTNFIIISSAFFSKRFSQEPNSTILRYFIAQTPVFSSVLDDEELDQHQSRRRGDGCRADTDRRAPCNYTAKLARAILAFRSWEKVA